jgi:hypothetical protein
MISYSVFAVRANRSNLLLLRSSTIEARAPVVNPSAIAQCFSSYRFLEIASVAPVKGWFGNTRPDRPAHDDWAPASARVLTEGMRHPVRGYRNGHRPLGRVIGFARWLEPSAGLRAKPSPFRKNWGSLALGPNGLPPCPMTSLRRPKPTNRERAGRVLGRVPAKANGCRGLPRIPAGSASALWISRPIRTSLALRRAGSLDRQKRPFVTRLQPVRSPVQAAR